MKKNLIMRLSLILILTFTLLACSPHPGAGSWLAKGTNTLGISHINVVFEGTADIYTADKEEAIRRCFWSAISKQDISMQCVYADDTDKKVVYQFMVNELGEAKLLQDEQLIGYFTEQSPEAAALERAHQKAKEKKK